MPQILAIETTCDETAAAVVEDGWRVKANVICSQVQLHQKYGGVVPEIASRAHIEWLNQLIDQALDQAGCRLPDMDGIAVAHCPGLVGCLIVGVSAAKALAFALDKPLIGVNHVHAHLYGGFLSGSAQGPPRMPIFPALGIVVSGGHSSLFYMKSFVDIQRIGATIDDAIGEAFDKVAALMELGYPGGAAVEKLARSGNAAAVDFPVSLLSADSLDFSYSGLKTAVLYRLRGRAGSQRALADVGPAERADIAASFQRAAVAPVAIKLCRAFKRFGAKSLILGGGVAANEALRSIVKQTADDHGVPFFMPSLEFCTDNAAMIGGLAQQRLNGNLISPLDLAAIATV